MIANVRGVVGGPVSNRPIKELHLIFLLKVFSLYRIMTDSWMFLDEWKPMSQRVAVKLAYDEM